MNENLRGFLVSISAISFGFLPIFAKFVYIYGMNVYDMLFYRFLIASLILVQFLQYLKDISLFIILQRDY